MLNASSNIYALNKANLCGTRTLKEVSPLTWVFVNEIIPSVVTLLRVMHFKQVFYESLHRGSSCPCTLHNNNSFVTFVLICWTQRIKEGMEYLTSSQRRPFSFSFFILAFCHPVALWLMFTNSVLTWLKEKERERRVGCLGMFLMFVSLLFRFTLNLSNALTLLYNPEMTSLSLLSFLSEFQLSNVCQQLLLLNFVLRLIQ